MKAFEFNRWGCLGEAPKIPLGIFLLSSPVLPGCLETYPLLPLLLSEPNFAELPL